ncbi:hypothetical protein OG866_43085 [Streptomyces sp. NBC_00663]|uniref:hypothetical protein n=1 Tax=Streptomyces sp. NBC_00663 TaxID=2975801 RepID=UPI002E37E112|nr:hypothetical protein [Streptomyces sp. NBC_00663]
MASAAAYTAAEDHVPSAAQQFAPLTEQAGARLVRGCGRERSPALYVLDAGVARSVLC